MLWIVRSKIIASLLVWTCFLWTMGCGRAMVSDMPAATQTPSPRFTMETPTPLPEVPGLSAAEIASLLSLRQVDDYPLYAMDYYAGLESAAQIVNIGKTIERQPWGCSLFAAFGAETDPLYGRNFDWSYSPALLLFAYPQDGYASVAMVDLAYFVDVSRATTLLEMSLEERRSLLNVYASPFDGMNAQGLVVGMAAVPEGSVPYDADKPTIGSLAVIREMLDHAHNVEAALDILQSYNIAMAGGPPIHYLIADAAGQAALVELYEGEVVVIPNTERWHAATNFYLSEVPDSAQGQCWRYDTLRRELGAQSGRLTPLAAMSLLSDVAQESTQWSIVYGMRSGEVRVALGMQYDQIHVFHLNEAHP